MKNLWLLLILPISIISCKVDPKSSDLGPSASESSVYADSLTFKLDSLYGLDRINGFSVAIADGNGILYEKGFGLMNLSDQTNYTKNTIQNIGSISKTFIGLGLMKAQELGMLKLDDPVNEYLPFEVWNPYFPDDTITIRQLASHTSSIKDSDAYDQKAYVSLEVLSDSMLTMMEETFNPPNTKIPFLDFLPKVLIPGGEYYSEDSYISEKPGTRFEYSNIGATLAALVLEMASAKPFDQFTVEHILNPLDMDTSGWSYSSIDVEQHSELYANKETVIPRYELITYPDGGLRSSAHDMALYLSELIKAQSGQGTLLSAESYQEYFNPVLNDDQFEERDAEFPYNDEYNMGVFMGHSGTGSIGHTGGDPGIASFMFFNPDTGLGQYAMINTSITDEEGVNQVFGILLALEEYAPKLTK